MNKKFKIFKKYSTSEDSFEIVLNHSLIVLGKSIEIINRKKLYNKIDFGLIVSGCLLHDIGIFGLKNGGLDTTKRVDYLQHGIFGGKILRKEKLFKEALIAERHIGSGLSKEYIMQNNLPLPKKDFLPITLEQKLICYADKFHSKSGKIDTLDSIKKEMKGFGKEPLRRFLELEKLFE
ncbi:MAG: HD domain-containing protein [Candidatus Pacebacteria bacterium]|nr:HD domain-containing protein [Candidatus Paceibacterota bacterium]